jgi:hypothetical protein
MISVNRNRVVSSAIKVVLGLFFNLMHLLEVRLSAYLNIFTSNIPIGKV